MSKLAQQLGGQCQAKVAPKTAPVKKQAYKCGGMVKKGKK